jgi:hypothetical protein
MRSKLNSRTTRPMPWWLSTIPSVSRRRNVSRTAVRPTCKAAANYSSVGNLSPGCSRFLRIQSLIRLPIQVIRSESSIGRISTKFINVNSWFEVLRDLKRDGNDFCGCFKDGELSIGMKKRPTSGRVLGQNRYETRDMMAFIAVIWR